MRRQSFGKMVGARPSDLAIPPPQHAGATMMGIYRTHTPSCTGREPALPPFHPPIAVSLLLPRRPPSPPSAGMSVWPSASRRDTTRPPTRTASAAGSRRLVSWSSACHRRRRRPRSFLAGRLAAAVARPPSRRSRRPPPHMTRRRRRRRRRQPQPASDLPAGSLCPIMKFHQQQQPPATMRKTKGSAPQGLYSTPRGPCAGRRPLPV
eukprot:COSAG01_NODE_12116_length_1798_cov_3.290171_2_plen_207_part_00